MIPCYKEHDTSFIWYYYAYDISKAILDLDPDLCQNFLLFVTSSILHIERCMIPLSKAVHKGFISFSYTLELWAIYGDVMTQKLKKTHVFACDCAFSSHRIKCNISTESLLWRASFLLPTLMSYEQYMRTLWNRSMKIWWFNRALCSLIHLLCFKRLIFETMSWSTFVDLQG